MNLTAPAFVALVAVSSLGGCTTLVGECGRLNPSRADCSYALDDVREIARFVDPWNETLARRALLTIGFEVRTVEGDLLRTREVGDERIEIFLPKEGPWQLQLVAIAAGGWTTNERANEHANALQDAKERSFDALLAGFERETGWRHVNETIWRPGIRAA